MALSTEELEFLQQDGVYHQWWRDQACATYVRDLPGGVLVAGCWMTESQAAIYRRVVVEAKPFRMPNMPRGGDRRAWELYGVSMDSRTRFCDQQRAFLEALDVAIASAPQINVPIYGLRPDVRSVGFEEIERRTGAPRRP